MTASLNLTLKRGPSVWDEHHRKSPNWRLVAATGGAIITVLSLRSHSSRRPWLAGLGLCALAICVGGQLLPRLSAGVRRLRLVGRPHDDDYAVDRAAEDSFPASDPPAFS